MLPSMWRTELLHPLSVHFPISLLIVGAVFYILSVFLSRNNYIRSLRKFSFLLIVIGTVAAWASIYTGTLAEDVISGTLCDPEVRFNHEDYAYYTAYLFTAFVISYIVAEKISQKFMPFFITLNIALLISGTATIAYVGHLGAALTYQQAAGVYNPGPECKGFE